MEAFGMWSGVRVAVSFAETEAADDDDDVEAVVAAGEGV